MNLLTEVNPELQCSLSHRISGLGLIERENSTILNAALRSVYRSVFDNLSGTMAEYGIQNSHLLLSRNDGTAERVVLRDGNARSSSSPCLIKTIHSGPSNSMIGASRLIRKHALIVDIGGTTTDLGIIEEGGFLSERGGYFAVARGTGIDCNFSAPRVDSAALGGGTKIKYDVDNNVTIKARSVGSELMRKAMCFGGDKLTATDIALAKGKLVLEGADIGRLRTKLGNQFQYIMDRAWDLLHKKLADEIENVWLSVKNRPLTVALVGGGSALFDLGKLKDLLPKEITEVLIPEHAGVINAIGAASGKISGECTAVVDLDKTDKSEVEAAAMKLALQRAVNNGASPNILKEYELVVLPERTKALEASDVTMNGQTMALQQLDSGECYLFGLSSKGVETRVNLDELSDPNIATAWKTLKNKIRSLPQKKIQAHAELNAFFMQLLGYERGVIKTLIWEPMTYLIGNPQQIRLEVCARLAPPSQAVKVPETPLPQANLTEAAEKLTTTPDKQEFGEDLNESGENVRSSHVTEAIAERSMVMTTEDINNAAVGCGILGSGGGGSTRFGHRILLARYKESPQRARRVSLDDLPDDAVIMVFGGMGSPTVVEEKLPSKELFVKLARTVEAKLHRKIDAILISEIGGCNGLIPLILSTELGIPVLDADTMGRALPRASDVMPCWNHMKPSEFIYGRKDASHIGILANSKKAITISGDDPLNLEYKARLATVEMGGIAFLGINIMDGKQAKSREYCIEGTLSTAIGIGKTIRNARKLMGEKVNILAELNKFLKGTVYKEARDILDCGKEVSAVGDKELSVGVISDMTNREKDGYNFGTMTIDYGEEKVVLAIQNENLLAFRVDANGERQLLAEVPTLITVVDAETFEPVPTGTGRPNQRVSVIAVSAPDALRTENALKVIGSRGYAPQQDADHKRDAATMPLYDVGAMWRYFMESKQK